MFHFFRINPTNFPSNSTTAKFNKFFLQTQKNKDYPEYHPI